MKNTTQGTVDNVVQKVDQAIDSGRKFFEEGAEEYGSKLKQGFDIAKDKAQSANTDIHSWVRKRPLMALGLALGAGLIVGRIFASGTRKRD